MKVRIMVALFALLALIATPTASAAQHKIGCHGLKPKLRKKVCHKHHKHTPPALPGPPGPPGSPGAQGKEGPQGKPGQEGPEGKQGEPGEPIEGPEGKEGKEGKPGKEGPQGKEGPEGKEGKPAPVGLSSWGPILRNEFGSPVSETNYVAGKGAIVLKTHDGTEKAEYGTELSPGFEFANLHIAEIEEFTFEAYITDQDVTFGNYAPNVQIEVNPHIAGKTYSSLVYNPIQQSLSPDQWTFVDPAKTPANNGPNPLEQGGWWFSSSAVAAATNCSQAHYCSLAEVVAAAPQAEVSLSVGFGKGRDSQFQGAIANFHIKSPLTGSHLYTFGPGGTFKS